MTSTTPGLTPAQLLFDRWLSEGWGAGSGSIEEFCSAHAEHGSELKALFAAWQLVAPTLASSGRSGTLQARLVSRFGAEVNPRVDLQLAEGEGEAESDSSDETLSRLATRGPASTRYTLRGEVARGGMGAVYRVWDEDLRRHLAMKVIIERVAGAASGEAHPPDAKLLSRFLEEAQVTGQLDHPGIVPVHELGLDSKGQVYFTMKLVKGKTLSTVFDELASGKGGWTRERVLGLLLKVCEAMACAHDKGVIHRDLKPSNVMVGRYGEVYVMDWGLARVRGRDDRRDMRLRSEAESSLTEVRSERRERAQVEPDSPLCTMDGDIVGTPAYMPPEQALGDIEALGPHSDVYAVGAMLYHLLTGQMPYVAPGVRPSAHLVLRWVQEGPPRALHELRPDAPAELAAICERAMERDPQRRYPDMGALVDDLSAFLEGRVVSAYETGPWAEARKWVKRNRVAAAAGAVAMLFLVGGSFTVAAIERKNLKREVEQNMTLALEKKLAVDAREAADKVTTFMIGVFSASSPSLALGREVTAAELLDKAAADLQGGIDADALVDAAFTDAVGGAYQSLGLLDEALEMLEAAYQARLEFAGQDHVDTWASANRLGLLYKELDRLDDAALLLEQCVAARRRLLGREHMYTLASVNNLGLVYLNQGRLEEAEELFDETVTILADDIEAKRPSALMSLGNLALTYSKQGRDEEVEPLYKKVLAAQLEALSADDPSVLTTQHNLGTLLLRLDRYEEAESILVDCLARRRRVLGEDNSRTLVTLISLGAVYKRLGRLDDAEQCYREVFEKRRSKHGEGHDRTQQSRNNLISLLRAQGRYDLAEELAREMVELSDEGTKWHERGQFQIEEIMAERPPR